MAPVEDNDDSGMESQEGSQAPELQGSLKEDEPEIIDPAEIDSMCEPSDKPKKPAIESDYDDEPDETLAERLWGLTEMFPESLRNATTCLVDSTQNGVKNLYCFSRSALWVVFSTSIILFAPVIFEVERAQMEEMQRSQQKQMLLGPNTAVSGGNNMPLMPPPMQR